MAKKARMAPMGIFSRYTWNRVNPKPAMTRLLNYRGVREMHFMSFTALLTVVWAPFGILNVS